MPASVGNSLGWGFWNHDSQNLGICTASNITWVSASKAWGFWNLLFIWSLKLIVLTVSCLSGSWLQNTEAQSKTSSRVIQDEMKTIIVLWYLVVTVTNSWNPFVFEFSGMGNWKMVRSRGLALWCGNWSAALRMSKCILEYLTGPDWVINYYGMSWWTTSSYTATLLFLQRGKLLGRAPDFGLVW